MQWIWELPGWPGFEWDAPTLQPLCARFLDNLERQQRQLANGRRFRILNLIDDFSRQ